MQAALTAAGPDAGTLVGEPRCSGDYATSSVSQGTGDAGYEATAVYQADDDNWVVIDRTGPCAGGAGNPIPAAIYQPACQTN